MQVCKRCRGCTARYYHNYVTFKHANDGSDSDDDNEDHPQRRAKQWHIGVTIDQYKYIKFQDNMYATVSFVHFVHWALYTCRTSFAGVTALYNMTIASSMAATPDPLTLDPTGRHVQKAWTIYRLVCRLALRYGCTEVILSSVYTLLLVCC